MFAFLTCPRTALAAALISTLLAVQACGGGDADTQDDHNRERQAQIDTLIAQADTQADQARTLGVDTPCDDQAAHNQCSGLWMTSAREACGPPFYHPYSLLGPTASAAEAAAQTQRQLAQQALMLQFPGRACPAIFPSPPVFLCQHQRCVAQSTTRPQP